MEKIKSRWSKNYFEGDSNDNNISNATTADNHEHKRHHHHHHHHHSSSKHHHRQNGDSTEPPAPPTFEILHENQYLDRRSSDHSKSRREARHMVCDCVLTKEERARGVLGCLDDCLNRMLMIECGPKCSLGEHCLNKRFQKCQSAKVEVFKTRKKGWGLRAAAELPPNTFIMEYVGEVVRSKRFRSRVKKYTKQKVKHHYFMALSSDEIIDATMKGNQTRFINHSCEPNCETQKWTVNGELRIGFFTLRTVQPGEEITFDYQFQRYGRKAQKCYCETPSCRGFIGGNQQTFSLNGSSSPQVSASKAQKKAYKHGMVLDLTLKDKISALAEDAAQGLKTRDQVIALASMSIKTEEIGDRRKLLEIIKTTKSEISLRLFVDYHGLEILSLWMRDAQADGSFKATVIEILEKLPIPNKTKVIESNVYRMIERWATDEVKTAPPLAADSTNDANNSGNAHNKSGSTAIDNDAEQKPINGEQSSQSDDTPPPSQQENNAAPPSANNLTSPNIKALASKLLRKFQSLSEGFKIPRLNRLQRMEMEKKMDEEVISDETAHNNDKSAPFEQKNPFSRNNYFKSSALAPASSTSTSTFNNLTTNKINGVIPPTLKRKFDVTTNNIDLTPKMSREEHRQQFEAKARQKDYYDALEKLLGPAFVEQMKVSQRTFNNPAMNGLLPAPPLAPQVNQNLLAHLSANPQLASNIPPAAIATLLFQNPVAPVAPPPNMSASVVQNQNPLVYPPQAQLQQQPQIVPRVVPSNTVLDSYHLASQQPPLASNQLQMQLMSHQQGSTYSQAISAPSEFSTQPNHHHNQIQLSQPPPAPTTPAEPVKPEPTILPSLVVLANDLFHPLDEDLAFSLCDYDEYYSIRDKPLNADDMLDTQYPYPGSYYITPDGDTWFATITLDRKTHKPQTVILKEIPVPPSVGADGGSSSSSKSVSRSSSCLPKKAIKTESSPSPRSASRHTNSKSSSSSSSTSRSCLRGLHTRRDSRTGRCLKCGKHAN